MSGGARSSHVIVRRFNLLRSLGLVWWLNEWLENVACSLAELQGVWTGIPRHQLWEGDFGLPQLLNHSTLICSRILSESSEINNPNSTQKFNLCSSIDSDRLHRVFMALFRYSRTYDVVESRFQLNLLSSLFKKAKLHRNTS
jgi:hypothetical protein